MIDAIGEPRRRNGAVALITKIKFGLRKFAVLGLAAASDVGTHPCFDLRANGVEAGVIIAHRSNVSFDHNVYSPVDIPSAIQAGVFHRFTFSLNAKGWQLMGAKWVNP